jgi:hypothetical protein
MFKKLFKKKEKFGGGDPQLVCRGDCPKDEEDDDNKGMSAWIIIVLIVLLCLVVGAVIYLSKDGDGTISNVA